jgi:hypothetical protein
MYRLWHSFLFHGILTACTSAVCIGSELAGHYWLTLGTH